MSEKLFRIIVLSVLGLNSALLLTVVLQNVNTKSTSVKAKAVAQPKNPFQPPAKNVDMNELEKTGFVIGDKSAKVSLALFNSFSCHYCQKSREPLNKILKEYKGKVKIIYKHYNRGGADSKPAQALECAGQQGKTWPMYNMIFEKGFQADFIAYAKSMRLNIAKFSQCIKADSTNTKIAADSAKGRAIGIRGTPGFVLNGAVQVGYRNFDAFKIMIDRELREN